jgi:hypothetical protein
VGTTSTRFRGATLLARDFQVELWLHLLVCEVDRLTSTPDWLSEARDYWDETAFWSGNGLYDPNLEWFLTEPSRVSLTLKLVRRVMAKLRCFGEVVPHGFLNELCRSPERAPEPRLLPQDPPTELTFPVEFRKSARFVEDLPTETLLAYGRGLHKLLEGKIHVEECA